MKFKISIRTKIILLIIIVILPLIVLNTVILNNEFNEEITNELDAQEELAEVLANSFASYIYELWIQQGMVGSYIKQNPEITIVQIQNYLQEVDDLQDSLSELSWVSLDGVIISSSRKEKIGVDISTKDGFVRIINGEDMILSDLTLSVLDSEPIIVVMRAIKDKDRLLGIISGIVNINKLPTSLPSSKLTPNSRYGLIDRNGMLVYKSGIENIPYENRKIPLDHQAWKSLTGGTVVKSFKRISYIDNSINMGVDYPISEFGWDCFVTTSLDHITNKYKRKLFYDLMVLTFVSLCSFIVAYYISRKFINRIINIKNTAITMMNGDYSVRTNIKGTDEIAVAATAFDSMADSIEKYDKAKTQFITNISHELKTPINVILSSAQLLNQLATKVDIQDDTYILKGVQAIKQNAYRLIRMTNNAIDISKLDFEKIDVKLLNCNIISIIEEITLATVKYANYMNIDIIFDTDLEEKVVTCDPYLLERIILSLLSNALKFTPKGGLIMVRILDRDDRVVISIKDNGIGIPHEKINIIYDLFAQVDNSLNRDKEGSGMGLYLVKALVKILNGNINVASEIGKGTEFIIELPSTCIDNYPNYEDMFSHSIDQRIAIELSDIYELRNIH